MMKTLGFNIPWQKDFRKLLHFQNAQLQLERELNTFQNTQLDSELELTTSKNEQLTN